MKIRPLRVVMMMAVICVLGMSCRSEFERIRMSANSEFILEKALEYYENKDYVKAQTLFELVLNQYRGRPEAEDIFFKYAYTFYNLHQYTLAAHYFRNFSETFAYSPLREEADYMSPYSHYKMSPLFRLDQMSSVEAIQGFQEFVNMYPGSDRVGECNELIREMRAKLEQKAFDSASLYYKMENYQAAIHEFENLLREYPDSDRAEEVQYLLLEGQFDYAENSIFERRQERYEEAIEKYREFVRRYPSSPYRDNATKVYEKTRKELKDLTE